MDGWSTEKGEGISVLSTCGGPELGLSVSLAFVLSIIMSMLIEPKVRQVAGAVKG
jgi:hypothetical protein